jgi:hypothetical protein
MRTILSEMYKEKKMSKPQDRTVYRNDKGEWVNKANGNSRATSVHRTQQEAIDAARTNLHNQGGGELTVQGRNGRFRSKDTIAPGNDPHPPKDTEN